MNRWTRVGLVVLLGAAIGGVLILELGQPASNAAEPAGAGAKKLPKLLDLGSKQCIPCKKMAPILEDLKQNYADRFTVEFIDVWLKENAGAAKTHKIRVIPTQILVDEKGEEVLRHEGFWALEDIELEMEVLGWIPER